MSEEVGADNLGSVEGIPQRDVAMRFTKHFASYNPGDTAYFHAHEAQELVNRGVAAAPVPTAGRLNGDAIPNPAGLLSAMQAVTNASFAITIASVAQEVGLMDFTGAASLAAIATQISTMMLNASCAWTDRFTITTDAIGPAATISYASAASSGTNIATTFRLTAATGAVLTQGT